MCQGSAAQALALLEALTDTNRRSLLSSVPVPADVADTELGDVYSELFMAAREIISGQFFTLSAFLSAFLFSLLLLFVLWSFL